MMLTNTQRINWRPETGWMYVCCSHYISTKAIRTLLLETIQAASTYAITNQKEFLEKVRVASALRQKEAVKDTKRKLNKNRKRADEQDVIIKKLYESFAVGRISDERFDSLLAEYEAEQKNCARRLQSLKNK